MSLLIFFSQNFHKPVKKNELQMICFESVDDTFCCKTFQSEKLNELTSKLIDGKLLLQYTVVRGSV